MRTLLRSVILSAIILSAAAAFSNPVHAYEVRRGKQIYVSKTDTVQGTLYAAGSNITIDGRVSGDLICGTQNLTVNGKIDGDLICGAQTVTINGSVAGNVRTGAQSVIISGSVGRNMTIFAQSLDIDRDARVGGELLIAGKELRIRGTVAKQVHGGIEDASVTGTLGQGLNLTVSTLDIGASARINGDVSYTSPSEATIDGKSMVKGHVSRHEPPKAKEQKRLENRNRQVVQDIIISVLSHILLAVLAVWLLGTRLERLLKGMRMHPAATAGWGLLILILTPLAALLVAFTVIGIPVAFIVLMAWVIALMVSRSLVGILVGHYLLSEFMPHRRDNRYLAAVFGVLLTILACNVPYVGWLVTLVSVCLGLGAIGRWGRS